MPELPEVETIRLGLQKYLVGHKIENVDVRLSKIVHGDTKSIIGARIVSVERFGKGLVINLDNNYSLAIHFKLTGQAIYEGPDTKNVKESIKTGGKLPNKRTHVIFYLDKDSILYYNDLRQFGWIRIIQSSKLKMQSFFKELGPEPLKNLTFNLFEKIVKSSSIAIKPLIMDQKKIAGIGNIYANDALFDSKILPSRKAKDLTNEETKRLYDSILKVLKKGLEYGGSSDENFVNALGQEGNYQNHTLIYGREGEKCRVCGSEIQKIQLGGRGTYFCEKCQH